MEVMFDIDKIFSDFSLLVPYLLILVGIIIYIMIFGAYLGYRDDKNNKCITNDYSINVTLAVVYNFVGFVILFWIAVLISLLITLLCDFGWIVIK